MKNNPWLEHTQSCFMRHTVRLLGFFYIATPYTKQNDS